MNRTSRRQPIGRAGLRAAPVPALAFLLLLTTRTHAQTETESLDRAGGGSIAGRVAGDARSGFRFVPAQGGAPIALEPGTTIHRDGPAPAATPGLRVTAGPPPFHLLIGEAGRLSGSLRSVDGSEVRLAPAWQAAEIALPRPSVQAIVQRPGEARILAEPFDRIDPARWSASGGVATVERSPPGSGRCLRLPPGNASVTHKLEEPLSAGRLEVAFHDDGGIARGRECVVESVFRTAAGPTLTRVILGRSEDCLSVESPAGLQIQRLARTAGWHRLTLRFGPDETEISIDGQELAHGRGPQGPLTSIKLATTAADTASSATAGSGPVAAEFDDLSLIRLVEPPASLEIQPGQDEARLVLGDQIFGAVRTAGSERIVLAVGGRPVHLRWGEVAGLFFRRVAVQGKPIAGLLVHTEWRSSPGGRPAEADFIEGALVALSDESLTLATPYAGNLTIPRASLSRLTVLGRGRRIVLDVAAHHLGDEVSITKPLDPPQPEGLSLERTADLSTGVEGPADLVLDVLEVVPAAGDSLYSLQIRKGELRTYAVVNGQRVDYLNRHILTSNESPERIRLAIPRGLLHPGKNTIRIELTGDSDPRPKYDDLGILQIALEFPDSAAASDPVRRTIPAAGAAGPGPP